ncbi:MAG: tRNA (5-methylaminomethyl-2-thiouridine)(34)-methyltransferase MnmD [Bacteroidales bacterium]|nr:tRNA (5-methylaminomethyl-2-thiouridine)(34)-methyltransferase MnmD [Bacteroidales bacterium]
MQKRELKITEDGSHTLFVPEIDECYHSTKGAVQESLHIFIEAGLMQCSKPEVNILEIGFGTGLNAFLTLLKSHELNQTINYIGIELYPIPVEKALQLNYPEFLNEDSSFFNKIHISPWNEAVQIMENFTLTKLNADFTKLDLEGQFDVIYFDAFSPEKQSEMWSDKMFKKLYLCAFENAVMTTYCSKGVVRRGMESVGFSVEKLPGPPGKREILRARKVSL